MRVGGIQLHYERHESNTGQARVSGHRCPGEKFALPEAVLDAVKEGQWLLTIERSPIDSLSDSFLRGYAPEDEGLYDDLVEQASN